MNNWISVKDKLPELYTEVLIYFQHGISCGYRIGKDWVTRFDWGYDSIDVTYWQELPEPPIRF